MFFLKLCYTYLCVIPYHYMLCFDIVKIYIRLYFIIYIIIGNCSFELKLLLDCKGVPRVLGRIKNFKYKKINKTLVYTQS